MKAAGGDVDALCGFAALARRNNAMLIHINGTVCTAI
jgi:hypothetical protein